MADDFSDFTVALNTPAVKAAAITPDDDNDLAKVTRAIYVGVDGDIACILAGDSAVVVFKNVKAGSVLPLRVKRMKAASTSATDLVALS